MTTPYPYSKVILCALRDTIYSQIWPI